MRYDELPDAALLRLSEITRPDGPVPYRRTKWLELVRAGAGRERPPLHRLAVG